MGSNASKTIVTDSLKPDPKFDIDTYTDPRSPTPEIARTPIHNKTGGKHNITKNIDLRKTFEEENKEKNIQNNPILSAVIKSHFQSYDPRSPTQDFERTPIIVQSKVEGRTDKELVENSNGSPCLKYEDPSEGTDLTDKLTSNVIAPRNLCNGFLDSTLDDSELPIGCSTASNDSIEKNISTEKSDEPKQLLETNFDYVEPKEEEERVMEEEGEDYVPADIKNLAEKFKILNHDPRSPSVGIDRTPIVVSKIDEMSNVEEMSDDTLLQVLRNTNTELMQGFESFHKNNDNLLIYEDETDNTVNMTPKKCQSASNSGSRTPLSCMKNKSDTGHTRSKSANTLSDPKDQKNVLNSNPKRVSHIPRLKSLSKQSTLVTGSTISLKNISKVSAVTGDCENTPPNSHRDCWSKDNSIVL